jgi:hypothetical protein
MHIVPEPSMSQKWVVTVSMVDVVVDGAWKKTNMFCFVGYCFLVIIV